jgi:hypothetical protein
MQYLPLTAGPPKQVEFIFRRFHREISATAITILPGGGMSVVPAPGLKNTVLLFRFGYL